MTKGAPRAGATWLALREPADAAARSGVLVDSLRAHVPDRGGLTVHDLGCGTGSMGRWLAPQLAGPQHWVLYERDAELLPRASVDPPRTADGCEVTTEPRHRDITRLPPGEISGAGLITTSALLDMLTTQELERILDTIAGVGCPALLALSVTGEVELTPDDPLDREVGDAFNAHQRRRSDGDRLLGPDAAHAAADGLTRRGWDVRLRPSPWHLGPGQAPLLSAWFAGWVGAACEQDPDLRDRADGYARRRLAQLADGRLSVTVQHRDLLALPERPW